MDIVDKFVKYFYKENFTFDERKEKLFREQMAFAQERYTDTQEYLIKYYLKWCEDPDAFCLPYGVFRTLFFDVQPELGLQWVQALKLKRKLAVEMRKAKKVPHI